MTFPTQFDCSGCGHTRWAVPGNEASYPDEEGLCAGCRDDGARRDAEAEVARLTRERDAALEAARGLLAAATFLDGGVFRCGICGRQGGDNHDDDFVCASAESTITAIETGAIHNDQ